MGPNETIRPMQAKKPAPRPLQPSPAPGGAEPAAQGTRLNKRLAELALGHGDQSDVRATWGTASWVAPEPFRSIGFAFVAARERRRAGLEA